MTKTLSSWEQFILYVTATLPSPTYKTGMLRDKTIDDILMNNLNYDHNYWWKRLNIEGLYNPIEIQ